MKEKYDSNEIETKWQKYWSEKKLYSANDDTSKEKFYCLEMFPYPSGKIHMGHVRNYAIGDVIARYKKMRGFNVLHPMGWDAFGLPAENAARNRGVHPAKWTYENIDYMKKQLNRLGLSYDWEREITTCSPEYYKWNQWFFLKLFEKKLAYKKASFVNWCPSCVTVLANEQVIDSRCWRCDSVVIQKELEQWFFKITTYSEELLQGCDELNGWPERVVLMQKNWIGKSEGVEIAFPVDSMNETIKIFTTRPDTIFGATFICLAYGHSIVEKLIKDKDKLNSIKEKYGKMEDKDGLFTGHYAINPLTDKKIPIYVANFVLMEYGTGAIMSVPGHDQRDFEFAKKYNLPIKVVIAPKTQNTDELPNEAYEDEGMLVDSGQFSGLKSSDAKGEIARFIESNGLGKRGINYKLRDWGISRQRYWGTPIPIIYCKMCGIVPVPEKHLPVLLPEIVKFNEEGGSLLFESEEFLIVNCPKCDGEARRETDTMDTFVDSSWYFVAFCLKEGIAKNTQSLTLSSIDYWMPVDQYIGGVEHAVLHLLYARFFTKVMRDLGVVSVYEPFKSLLTQGMVCKETWKCHEHGWLLTEEVKGGRCKFCGLEVEMGRVEKMSKSKKNVVDSDLLINKYGADTLRLFSLFAAPPEKDLQWSDSAVEGAYRFLSRIWGNVYKSTEHRTQSTEHMTPNPVHRTRLLRKTHQTIKKVTNDIDKDYHFNTAIAALMELLNEISSYKSETEDDQSVLRFSTESIVLMLAPFAPHISEELWEAIGNKSSIFEHSWPDWDKKLAKEDEIELVIQINGKLKTKLFVPVGLSDDDARDKALKEQKIKKILNGKEVKKIIVVKGRLVNIVMDG